MTETIEIEDVALISDAAEQFSITVRSIRYYEEQHLLSTHLNSRGRRYVDADGMRRLRFIVESKAAGFALCEIALCIRLAKGNRLPRWTVAQLRRQLDHLEGQQKSLAAQVSEVRSRLGNRA